MTLVIVDIFKGTLNAFVVMVAIALGQDLDVRTLIGYVIMFVLGLTLRLLVEYNNNTITWKNSIVQAGMGAILSYMSVHVCRDWFPTFKVEYCIFCCSLFSIFIVDFGIKAFKKGLPNVARLWASKILAENPKQGEE